MKKQPEITAQTRERLIEAFWSLYREKKIEQITIKQITDLAGYHRSTFYEYFVDIYDVLNQLEDDLLGYFKTNVIDKMNGLDPQQRVMHRVKLTETIHSDGRESYLRVAIHYDGNETVARLTGHQGSGNLRSLVDADALLIVPSGVKSMPVGSYADAWFIDG